MKPEYMAWIAANVTETYGKCAKVTEAMQLAFPELTRVRGHYYCLSWGERSHWWLVDTDGEVVDPTAAQFPSGGHGVYVPWEEGTPEPTGVCPNCGGYVYTGDTCCSENCGLEYVAYINSFR
jgi:hypothetical protein